MRRKTTLADAIRARLKADGLTVRQLADRIGFPDATVRTWLHRNKFPRRGAILAASALGLGDDADRLAEMYDTDDGWATPKTPEAPAAGVTLGTAFQIMDRRRDRLGRGLEALSRNVAMLMGTMRDGDLFVFCSATVTPMEFEKHLGQHLAEAIAAGVVRGGTYLYLRPDDSVVRQYYRNDGPWRLRRILMVDDFETEFTDFRHNLVNQVRDKFGQSEEEAVTTVAQHTAQYYVRESLFWAPGFTIGMFQTQNNLGAMERRLTVRLPTGFGGIIYLPPDDLFTWRFGRCVHQALEEQGAKLEQKQAMLKTMKGAERRAKEKECSDEHEVFTAIKRMMEAKYTPE